MTPRKLETEFTVPVPPEQAWRTLTDLGALADALPGGGLSAADGVYTGRVELEADGARIPVQATLRAIDEDEDERVATVELSGRQLDGPAIGSVVLSGRLEPVERGARIRLTAEIRSSGHAPAGDSFEAVADRILEQLADRLRQRAQAPPPPEAGESPAVRELAVPTAGSAAPPMVSERRRRRLAAAGAGAVAVLALIRAVRRGRRGRR